MENRVTSIRGKLFFIAIFYTAFVIYGSLVPLKFVSIPFDVAWQQFSSINFLKFSINNRSDWGTNVLLFIPLTFLWSGVLWFNCHKFYQYLIYSFIILLAAFLSTSIEFTQTFIPDRTVSQNDILAESIGGVIGVLTWVYYKYSFIRWFERFLHHRHSNRWRLYLEIYIFILFTYSIMPLDLTVSPVELFHKWEAGRLIFIPFIAMQGDPLIVFYKISTDVLTWTPIAILWSLTRSLSNNQVIIKTIITAAFIEFFQLFVFSRYSDLTDIITAAIGAYLGVYIVKKFKINITPTNTKQVKYNQKSSQMILLGSGTLTIWLIILLIVYWYPFNFWIDKTHISDRFNSFFSVPFASYYSGSEYLAITQIFRKLLFAIPLGISLALLSLKHRSLSLKPVFKIIYSFIIFGIFFGLELGQILVPDRTANFTDVVLSSIGGMIGLFAFRTMLLQYFKPKELISKSISTKSTEPQIDTAPKKNRAHRLTLVPICKENFIYISIGIAILYLFLIGLAGSSEIPYNFKEIYANNFIYISSLGFSILIFWTFGYPLAASIHLAQHNLFSIKILLLYLLIHSLVTWLLIRSVIPLESIYDIIGFPTWGFAPELEMPLRFFGLFILFSGALFGSSMQVLKRLEIQPVKLSFNILYWILYFIMLVPIGYLVVIHYAGTDNITELLHNDGKSIHFLYLIFYIILISFISLQVSLFIRHPFTKGFFLSLLFLLLSAPVGYYLIQTATEKFIFKYDKVFSALQFLLSNNRDSYIAADRLFLRFFIAHTGIIIVLAFTQFHVWMLKGKYLKL